MKSCTHFQKLIRDSFTGDLDAARKIQLENHLKTCRACRREYSEYRAAVKSMQQRSVAPPDPEFMHTIWTRLAPRLDPLPKNRFSPRLKFQSIPLRWAVPVTAVICLLAGIWLGRSTELFQRQNMHQGPSQKNGRMLLESRADRLIQQSQHVLLAFVNFDTLTDDPEILDIPYQKHLAQMLAQQTGDIRSGMTGARGRSLSELLNDLEFIMLQIANSDEHKTLDIVDIVRQSVDQRDVLFKIQIRSLDRHENEEKPTKNI